MSQNNNIALLRKDIEFLKKEEMKNQRKLRLLQVRQQNRDIALKVRQNVQQKKYDEILKVAHRLDQEHIEEQRMRVEEAERHYLEGLTNFGSAYSNVCLDDALHKKSKADKSKNKMVAYNRFKKAISTLKTEEAIQTKSNLALIGKRNLVKNKEKLRAKKVASLPKPADVVEKASLLSTRRNNSISSNNQTQSHYPSLYSVAIRHNNSYDAKAAAQEEEKFVAGLKKEKSCVSLAMQEKAYLRHKAAVSQERLNQDLLGLEKEICQLRQKQKFRR